MPSIQILIYIVTWLLSYFASRKAGLSTGAAALVATGATGLMHVSGAGEKLSGWLTGTSAADVASTTAPGVSSIGATMGEVAGATLPTLIKTGAVVGATVGVGSAISQIPKWLLVSGGGLLAYLLLRK